MSPYLATGADAFIELARTIPADLPQPIKAEEAIFVQRLSFAQGYAEFLRARKDNDLASAAEYLVDLFSSEIAPSSWWAVLLTDAADLLAGGTY